MRSNIERNPRQPRHWFDDEELNPLAASMPHAKQIACIPYGEEDWKFVNSERMMSRQELEMFFHQVVFCFDTKLDEILLPFNQYMYYITVDQKLINWSLFDSFAYV